MRIKLRYYLQTIRCKTECRTRVLVVYADGKPHKVWDDEELLDTKEISAEEASEYIGTKMCSVF